MLSDKISAESSFVLCAGKQHERESDKKGGGWFPQISHAVVRVELGILF